MFQTEYRASTPISEHPPQLTNAAEASKFDEICWMLCKGSYHSTFNMAGTLTKNEQLLYKLWRLFNLRAEEDEDGNILIPIVIHVDELIEFLKRFLEKSGKSFNQLEFERKHAGVELLGFRDVLKILDNEHCVDIDEYIVESAMSEMYEELIKQVLQKVKYIKSNIYNIYVYIYIIYIYVYIYI